MHPKIAQDPRTDAHEGLDARKLSPGLFPRAPRLITCDVSFISLKLILPAILPLAGDDAALAALIKPQFEVGPAHVVKGIAKSEEAREKACADVAACVEAQGWNAAQRYFASETGEVSESKLAKLNPHRADPERARWRTGFRNAAEAMVAK